MLSRGMSYTKLLKTNTFLRTKHLGKKSFSANKVVDTLAEEKPKAKTLGGMGSKYKIFIDDESETILDMNEEGLKYDNMLDTPDVPDPFDGINLERGKSGVYDIGDLVNVLKRDNAEDIFVASVPPNMKYVDYLCIVSGNSLRHMLAMAQFVRQVFKKKMYKYDPIPRLEGENSKDWLALDLGNIALHIFSKEARLRYDLDTLWSVGSAFDVESKRQDPVAEMLEKHSVYLKGLQPAQ